MKKTLIIIFACQLITLNSQVYYCIEQYRNDTLIEQTYFNSHNQPVKRTQQIFTPAGKDVIVHEWGYNDQLLVATEKIIYNQQDVFLLNYLYDEFLRPVRVRWLKNNHYEGKEVFLYQGKVLEKHIRFGPTQIIWEKVYTYDSSLRVVRMDFFMYKDSILSSCKEYHYLRDKEGRVIKEICFSSGDTVEVINYGYDNMGRKIKQVISIPGVGQLLEISWKYSKNLSQPIREIHRQNGYIVYVERLNYGRDGRILRKKTIDYRNFSGKMKPIKNVYTYRYYKTMY